MRSSAKIPRPGWPARRRSPQVWFWSSGRSAPVSYTHLGLGLQLVDYPGISVRNLDPHVLLKLDLTEEDGRLIVPVAAVIPARLMGSGIGASSTASGDYDITTTDPVSYTHLDVYKRQPMGHSH